MTDDLKTKIAEAILEAMGAGPPVPFPERATLFALQAIHDAGYELADQKRIEDFHESGIATGLMIARIVVAEAGLSEADNARLQAELIASSEVRATYQPNTEEA